MRITNSVAKRERPNFVQVSLKIDTQRSVGRGQGDSNTDFNRSAHATVMQSSPFVKEKGKFKVSSTSVTGDLKSQTSPLGRQEEYTAQLAQDHKR